MVKFGSGRGTDVPAMTQSDHFVNFGRIEKAKWSGVNPVVFGDAGAVVIWKQVGH